MKKFIAILLTLGALMSTVATPVFAQPNSGDGGDGAARESGSAQSMGQ